MAEYSWGRVVRIIVTLAAAIVALALLLITLTGGPSIVGVPAFVWFVVAVSVAVAAALWPAIRPGGRPERPE